MSSISDEASAISMNNHGAKSIAIGDLHSAIDHLSSALRMSRTSVFPRSGETNHPTFDFTMWMVEGYRAMEAEVDNEEISQRISLSNVIYSSPIQVPFDFSAPGLHIDVALASIVIFNLALAHHLLAIQTHEHPSQLNWNGSPALVKAMKLYDLAIQLQHHDDAIRSANHSKLFILSCLNNLGNVYRLLGDEQASECCYQQLQTLLMYLNYCDGYSNASMNYSVFFKNTLQQKRNAGSAA